MLIIWKLVVNFFVKPLRILGYISNENISAIFSNIEEIYEKNNEFLSYLKPRIENWNIDSTLGDIFVQHSHLFSAHMNFVTGFMKGSEVLKSSKAQVEFYTFLNVVRAIPQCGQQLENLLIMPVQRIPRYVLLLSDLTKRTPAEHADTPLLIKATEQVSKFAQNINENNRKTGAVAEWLKVQSSFSDLTLPENGNRGLFETIEAKVQFTSAKISKKEKDHFFVIFLLSDFLVIAKHVGKRISVIKTKEDLKAVLTFQLNKQLSYKKVDSGIDFGTAIVEFDSEEKLKIWLRIISECCNS